MTGQQAADVIVFHAIIALETIEHVPDPLAFVTDIHRRLNPSGVTLIATPNGDSYPRWLKWNTDLPPVHLQWISVAGLTSVLRRAGFEVTLLCAVGLNAARANAAFSATPDFYRARLDSRMIPMPSESRGSSLECWEDRPMRKWWSVGMKWRIWLNGHELPTQSSLGGGGQLMHGARSQVMAAVDAKSV